MQSDRDSLTLAKALEKSARQMFSRDEDVQHWVAYWSETVRRNEELVTAFQTRGRLDFTGRVVLDVGCGTGGLAKAIREASGCYIGLDFHPILTFASLLTGELDLKDVSFARASATHLPFKTGSVDYIVAFDVIEHLVGGYRWQVQFMREMRRVLGPEGLILLTTQNKLYPLEGHTFLPFPHYLPTALADLYVRWRKPGFFQEYQSFKEVQLLSPWRLQRLLSDSGLAVLHDLPWCMDFEDYPQRQRRFLQVLRHMGLHWAWTKGFWLIACREENLARLQALKTKEWLRA